ncbi:unnamed protein product [Pedinophyceae sp. YPF-701]|nr:unnamed protein product [Pedinophyceae sp. YPF-701]
MSLEVSTPPAGLDRGPSASLGTPSGLEAGEHSFGDQVSLERSEEALDRAGSEDVDLLGGASSAADPADGLSEHASDAGAGAPPEEPSAPAADATPEPQGPPPAADEPETPGLPDGPAPAEPEGDASPAAAEPAIDEPEQSVPAAPEGTEPEQDAIAADPLQDDQQAPLGAEDAGAGDATPQPDDDVPATDGAGADGAPAGDAGAAPPVPVATGAEPEAEVAQAALPDDAGQDAALRAEASGAEEGAPAEGDERSAGDDGDADAPAPEAAAEAAAPEAPEQGDDAVVEAEAAAEAAAPDSDAAPTEPEAQDAGAPPPADEEGAAGGEGAAGVEEVAAGGEGAAPADPGAAAEDASYAAREADIVAPPAPPAPAPPPPQPSDDKPKRAPATLPVVEPDPEPEGPVEGVFDVEIEDLMDVVQAVQEVESAYDAVELQAARDALDPTVELTEALQSIAETQLGGSAKVVVMGGIGASEEKPSVFKHWPGVYADATAGGAEGEDGGAVLGQTVTSELFEDRMGGEYCLSDLCVMDVASLQWSKPVTHGTLDPPRGGHAAAVVPLRVFAAPEGAQAQRRPGRTDRNPLAAAGLAGRKGQTTRGPGTPAFVHLSDLLRHVARMEGPGEAGEVTLPGRAAAAGRAVASTMLQSLVACANAQGVGAGWPYGTMPMSFVEELFHMALATRSPELVDGRSERLGLMNELLKAIRVAPDVGGRGAHDMAVVKDVEQALTLPAAAEAVQQTLPHAMLWTTPSPHHAIIQAGRVEILDVPQALKKASELYLTLEVKALRPIFKGMPTPFRGVRAGATVGPPWDTGVAAGGAHIEAGQLARGLVAEAVCIVGGLGSMQGVIDSLLSMLAGERSSEARIALIARLPDVRAPGEEEQALVEIGSGTIDLLEAVDEDVVAKTITLYEPTHMKKGARTKKSKKGGDADEATGPSSRNVPVARCNVTVLMRQALNHIRLLGSKTYVDAFRLVVHGGASAALPGPGAPPGAVVSKGLAPSSSLMVYDAIANKWQELQPDPFSLAPAGRARHAIGRAGHVLYVTGGVSHEGAVLGDLHALDTTDMTWQMLTPQQSEWTMLLQRHSHSMTVLPGASLLGERTVLLIYGGVDGSGAVVAGGMVALDVTRAQQRQLLEATGADAKALGLVPQRAQGVNIDPAPVSAAIVQNGAEPPGRRGHATCVVSGVREGAGTGEHACAGSRIYVYGGRVEGGGLTNDLYCAHVEHVAPEIGGEVQLRWEKVETSGPAPPKRESASMVAIGSWLVVVNGWVGLEATPWTRDCYLLSTTTNRWASLAFPDHFPSGRFLHAGLMVDFRAGVSRCSTLHGPVAPPLSSTTQPRPAPRDLSAGPPSEPVRVTAGKPLEFFVQSRDVTRAPADRAGDGYTGVLLRLSPSEGDDLAASVVSDQEAAARGLSLDQAISRLQGVAQEVVTQGGVTDMGSGLYSLTMTPVASGRYLLCVTGEDGHHVRGSPLPVQVDPGPLAMARTVASGEGLKSGFAGEPLSFFVHPYDQLGNNLATSKRLLRQLHVRVLGPHAPAATLTPEPEHGRIRVTYVPEKTGTYRVRVKAGQHDVPGSPFSVGVKPGPLEPAKCEVTGRVVGARWVVNYTAHITVRARDAQGNKCSLGGGHFRLLAERVSASPDMPEGDLPMPSASDPEPKQADVVLVTDCKDNNDGTYAMDIKLPSVGLWRLCVETKKGIDVAAEFGKAPAEAADIRDALSNAKLFARKLDLAGGKPFAISVTSGTLDPSKCSLFSQDAHTQECLDRGAPVTLRAGERGGVRIQARDTEDAVLRGGNDLFIAWLEPKPLPKPLPAIGAGGNSGAIVAADRDRDLEEQQRRIDAMDPPTERTRHAVPVKVEDLHNGQYEVTMSAFREGAYWLMIEGSSGFTEQPDYRPVNGCPVSVRIEAGPTVPSQCVARGGGLEGDIPAGELAQFRVYACDDAGNRKRVGGDRVDVSVWGGWEVPVEVVDNFDGTYDVSYLPGSSIGPGNMPLGNSSVEIAENTSASQLASAARIFRVDVCVNGQDLLTSPFFPRVIPVAVDPARCELEGVPENLVAGKPHQIVVRAKDSRGVPITVGGTDFRIALFGDNASKVLADIRDRNDGTYGVRLLANLSGYYDIVLHVTLKGKHVAGSPLHLSVVPRGLFGAGFWTGARAMDESATHNFILSGDGMHSAVAGEETQFEIAAKRLGDATPGEAFSLELRGPEEISGNIEGPDESGVYYARYRCTLAGEYLAVVKLAKYTLQGCPFTVKVSAAATHAPSCEVKFLNARVKNIGDEGRPETPVVSVGERLQIEILPRDRFGNLSTHREDRFSAHISGGHLDMFVKSHKVMARFKGGRYTVPILEVRGRRLAEWIPDCRGAFGMSVTYLRPGLASWDQATDIGNSPYEIDVNPPPRTARKFSDLRDELEEGAARQANLIAEKAFNAALFGGGAAAEGGAEAELTADEQERRQEVMAQGMNYKARPKRLLKRLRGMLGRPEVGAGDADSDISQALTVMSRTVADRASRGAVKSSIQRIKTMRKESRSMLLRSRSGQADAGTLTAPPPPTKSLGRAGSRARSMQGTSTSQRALMQSKSRPANVPAPVEEAGEIVTAEFEDVPGLQGPRLRRPAQPPLKVGATGDAQPGKPPKPPGGDRPSGQPRTETVRDKVGFAEVASTATPPDTGGGAGLFSAGFWGQQDTVNDMIEGPKVVKTSTTMRSRQVGQQVEEPGVEPEPTRALSEMQRARTTRIRERDTMGDAKKGFFSRLRGLKQPKN